MILVRIVEPPHVKKGVHIYHRACAGSFGWGHSSLLCTCKLESAALPPIVAQPPTSPAPPLAPRSATTTLAGRLSCTTASATAGAATSLALALAVALLAARAVAARPLVGGVGWLRGCTVKVAPGFRWAGRVESRSVRVAASTLVVRARAYRERGRHTEFGGDGSRPQREKKKRRRAHGEEEGAGRACALARA